ncbi:MAG: hypothetical protein HYS98_07630 [Deltaproteobacteria bacterium]|nr:hypothetical protein [Deltaproteobacteria bacterium]
MKKLVYLICCISLLFLSKLSQAQTQEPAPVAFAYLKTSENVGTLNENVIQFLSINTYLKKKDMTWLLQSGNKEYSLGKWENIQNYRALFENNVLFLMLELQKGSLYEICLVVFDIQFHKEPQMYFLEKSPYHFEFDISNFKSNSTKEDYYSFATAKKNENKPFYSDVRWQAVRVVNGIAFFSETHTVTQDSIVQLKLSPHTVSWISQNQRAVFYSIDINDQIIASFKKLLELEDVEGLESIFHKITYHDMGSFFIKYISGQKRIILFEEDQIQLFTIENEDRGPILWTVFDDEDYIYFGMGVKDLQFENLKVELYRVEDKQLQKLVSIRHILPTHYHFVAGFSAIVEKKLDLHLEILLEASIKHQESDSHYFYNLKLRPLY